MISRISNKLLSKIESILFIIIGISLLAWVFTENVFFVMVIFYTGVAKFLLVSIDGTLFFSTVYTWFREYSKISTDRLPVKSVVSSEIPVITVDSLTDQENEVERGICKTFNIEKGLYNRLTLEDTVELSQGKHEDYPEKTFFCSS